VAEERRRERRREGKHERSDCCIMNLTLFNFNIWRNSSYILPPLFSPNNISNKLGLYGFSLQKRKIGPTVCGLT